MSNWRGLEGKPSFQIPYGMGGVLKSMGFSLGEEHVVYTIVSLLDSDGIPEISVAQSQLRGCRKVCYNTVVSALRKMRESGMTMIETGDWEHPARYNLSGFFSTLLDKFKELG